MKTGRCRCGNRIFFNNVACLSCSATLGRCEVCRSLTSISTNREVLLCDECNAEVQPCVNQAHGVCHSYGLEPNSLCQWCKFTRVTPSLHRPESVRRWAVVESAKRRLLLQLEDLQLPPFLGEVRHTHPLLFSFLEDDVPAEVESTSVVTGHANGMITLNLAEADSVYRERQRVELNEPQRTLIGHMRHEIGHYIDWCWASCIAAEEYHRLFGDPQAVVYATAMQRYYAEGPLPNWNSSYVSAYATMHPWEDFAETVNAYLDIMAIASTANDLGRASLDLSPTAELKHIVTSVLEIVIEVSEFNYELGLLPLLPEQFPPAVLGKLEYVHGLRRYVVASDSEVRNVASQESSTNEAAIELAEGDVRPTSPPK